MFYNICCFGVMIRVNNARHCLRNQRLKGTRKAPVIANAVLYWAVFNLSWNVLIERLFKDSINIFKDKV